MDESELWRYRARLRRVVDGDTLDMEIDLGFGLHFMGEEARLRLLDIDTAETFGVPKDSEEYRRGQTHKEWVARWLTHAEAQADHDWPLFVETIRGEERGKYGRYLARVIRRSDGTELTNALISEFGEEVSSN